MPEDSLIAEKPSTDEIREAYRACRGMVLRKEIYTPDGSELAHIPYSTSYGACRLEMLQPRQENNHSVWMAQQSETLNYNYERNPQDPRIAHTLVLATDAYGHTLEAATVSYGRKLADPDLSPAEQAEQGKLHIVCLQNKQTNAVDAPASYRLPLPYENRSWELTGIFPGNGPYFNVEELKAALNGATSIPFEAAPTPNKTEKRLLDLNRVLFSRDDQTGPLPLGVIESLALPYQSYKMALTPGLSNYIFGDKVNQAQLLEEGKYLHFDDDNYWVASGTVKMDASNFYQVTLMNDPFGSSLKIVYDSAYHLFVQQTIDALGNSNIVEAFNFRTLQPYLIKDLNDNLKGLRTDELGMAIAGFVMGKTEENKGDFMDLSAAEASDNDHPGIMISYDLFNFINQNHFS
jgi:hypothetical protein